MVRWAGEKFGATFLLAVQSIGRSFWKPWWRLCCCSVNGPIRRRRIRPQPVKRPYWPFNLASQGLWRKSLRAWIWHSGIYVHGERVCRFTKFWAAFVHASRCMPVASTLKVLWPLYKPNTVRVIALSSSKSVLIQRKMYAMQVICANGWALKLP